MKIKITIGSLEALAELDDTVTARQIWDSLPWSGPFSTWGDEIYFFIPVEAPLDETAREWVEVGELGYWPSGRAFCIFFGPTPVSTQDKIIPASAVNIIGRVVTDPLAFKEVMGEAFVTVEQADDEATE
ncbi:MAG: cyclophilin-like fold protein [Desulfomonilaceae bacterium]